MTKKTNPAALPENPIAARGTGAPKTKTFDTNPAL
jgi:hypothetical protein